MSRREPFDRPAPAGRSPYESSPVPSLRGYWSIALLGLAAAAFLFYVLLPPSRAAEALRVAAPAIAAVVALQKIRHRGPEGPTRWIGLAASMLLLAVGQVVQIGELFDSGPSFPVSSDAFRLASAVLIFLAVVDRSREIGSTNDEFGRIESAIIAIAIGVCLWLALVEPYLGDDDSSSGVSVTMILIPTVGALSFALMFRVCVNSAPLYVGRFLFTAAIGLQVIVEAVGGALVRAGEFGPGGVVAGLAIVWPLVLAAAIAHPSTAPGRPSEPREALAGNRRTFGISLAVLTPSVILVVLAIGDRGTTTTRVVVSIAAVLAVLLALVRMSRLVDRVRVIGDRRAQDRLAALVENSGNAVLLLDPGGDIRYAGPGLRQILGDSGGDWIGRPAIDLVTSRERARAWKRISEISSRVGGGAVDFETTLLRSDGSERRVEATLTRLPGPDAADSLVLTLRDVTEQRELEQQLSHRAYHDELTGLANRASFLDRIDDALRAHRPDIDPVVVLFLDLDDFKAVNDALGHAIGDRLLGCIAEAIRGLVGPGDTPARLGGDEFAVLLAGAGGVDRALGVAQLLLDRFERPFPVAGYELTVRSSVGVAVAAPGMATSELLRDADTAMYEAKRAGKGQVKIFDPAMQLRSSDHLASQDELAAGLERGELRLVYQPFMSLETGEVLGAQAMLRWAHPERGDVPSDEFIPIAEATGLVGPIGRWVLRQAFHEAVVWQQRGHLRLGVKVPPGLLRVPGFLDEVRSSLRSSGLDPRCVVLGIPGDALVDALDGAQKILEGLRAEGIVLSVSDFGAGGLSLVDLRRADIDVLRIDEVFVEELDADDDAGSVARVVLETCATLGIVSSALGISRLSQLTALRRHGCLVGQGPLLSPPLEVAEVRRRFGLPDVSTAPTPADV